MYVVSYIPYCKCTTTYCYVRISWWWETKVQRFFKVMNKVQFHIWHRQMQTREMRMNNGNNKNLLQSPPGGGWLAPYCQGAFVCCNSCQINCKQIPGHFRSLFVIRTKRSEPLGRRPRGERSVVSLQICMM